MDLNSYLQFLKNFFVDRQFFVLLSSTVVMFLAVYIMWYFYHKQLTKKDLFVSPKEISNNKFENFIDKVKYVCKYLVIFPIYSFVWFLIFSFLLVIIAKARPVEEIMFFGIVIVSVTRISAYVSPILAEDMAKLLPWALIIIFLTDPKSITLETIRISFTIFTTELPKVAKYLMFMIFVEWVLRIGHWIIGSDKKIVKTNI
ncbi:MAG TPA: hypothetical protein VI564_00015 [Candidatus Nanoarchaeia archaeon]|nr:hypothetical protein [Candidatus Nanoarchaeia archaeon]